LLPPPLLHAATRQDATSKPTRTRDLTGSYNQSRADHPRRGV
jgi:hypothetical protein